MVIVACWCRLNEQWENDEAYFLAPDDKDPYGTVDHAVAATLGLPVSHVDEALVAAGKRTPEGWGE